MDLSLPGHPLPQDPRHEDLVRRARTGAGSLAGALDVARAASAVAPLPASGATAQRWSLLAALSAEDLTVGRVVEAHLDALAILAEAGHDTADARELTWGVFAAEGQGGVVQATATDDGWRLSGTKPWCSAAGALDRALVTARVPHGRRLLAVDLHDPGVEVREGTWVSRGLVDVPSGPVDLHDVPGTPIGDPGWYVDRPGLAWGGMGVAACWYGGAVGVARRLWAASAQRPPDDVALVHLGAVDTVLHSMRSTLATAAAAVDAGEAVGPAGRLLSQRVRAAAARCVDEVLARAAHGLGPAPLSLEEEHARRVADLQVYVRQQHAERDDLATGRLLREAGGRPW